ncbi:MAG: MFS transporter [Streptosporangiaceae bacterium]|nr:MFS transporter [Streptosporangiaceae bacterium]
MREPATNATPRGAWITLALVAGGLFLAVMSTTLVGVALPSIGKALRADPAQLEWVVDAYVIVYSSFLVAGGAIGDRRGRKGLFLLGVCCFGTGSMLTGMAGSVPVLLAGRAVAGLGPALLVPGSLTIIRAVFTDERKRAVAIGLWSTASGVALAVGPVLGGALVAWAGWRAVFLFNVPLSAVLALAGARFIPRLPRSRPEGRFDWLGAVLTVVTISALAYATIDGQSAGWTSPAVYAGFAAGAAALAAFVSWERHVRHPLVDVRLFAQPAFTAANVAAFVVFFAFVGAIVYFSAYFQQASGDSALNAGLDISAIGVAFAIAASVSGRVVARIGPRLPMTAGLALAGGATLGLLRLRLGTGIGAIWWDFALLGAGTGLSLTPMTAVAMSAVGSSRAGMVSAVHNALRQVGQVFGVAVLGALVYARLPGGSAGAPLNRASGQVFIGGLHHALWVSGLALLAAALLAATLSRQGAPDGRPPREGAVRVGEHQQAAFDAQFEEGVSAEAGPDLAVALVQDPLPDYRAHRGI